MPLPEPIGKRIALYRDIRGLTQLMLSARMQVRGHATLEGPRISEIENGVRDVSAAELVSFARVFNIPISELLGVPDFDPTDR